MGKPVDLLAPANRCFRCDYDLRGLDEDRACPECGLLISISRNPSDELRHARTRWLKRMAWGIWIVLAGLLMHVGWLIWCTRLESGQLMIQIQTWDDVHTRMIALALFTAVCSVGICMTTATEREYHGPRLGWRRRWTRRLRWMIRIVAWLPVLAILGDYHAAISYRTQLLASQWGFMQMERRVAMVLLVGSVALLSLVWPLHMRQYAQRARSPHLAEHCRVIALGGSAAYLLAGLVMGQLGYPYYFALSGTLLDNSVAWWTLAMFPPVAVVMFWLWALYVVVQFSVRFWIEAKANQHIVEQGDKSRPLASASPETKP